MCVCIGIVIVTDVHLVHSLCCFLAISVKRGWGPRYCQEMGKKCGRNVI